MLIPGFALLTLVPAFAAPVQEPERARDEAFLILDVRVWQGDADEAPRRNLLIDGHHLRVTEEPLDPADHPRARVLRAGEDWIAYPGLVHGAVEASLPDEIANPYAGDEPDPRRGPIPDMDLADRQHFFGWMRVADHLRWNPERGSAWRAGGFTAAHVVPDRGLVQGFAALASWNGLPLGDALLQREGFQVHALRGVGRQYPRTPMAALAVHRQLLLDEASLDGRPAPDLALAGRRLFRASSARAIENVLDLTEGVDAEVAILGGRDAWRIAGRLAERDVAVLYVLDLEDPPPGAEEDGDEGAAPDAGAPEGRPFWRDPGRLREERLRLHREQVEGFLRLREAGVRCALVPGGSPEDFREDLGQLLDAGLDADAAVAALSTELARILHLVERPGDWVVSRGALDPRDPDLAWVFTAGHGWEIPEDEEDGEDDDGDGDVDPAAMSGAWLMTVETPMGDEEFGAALDVDAGTVEIYEPASPDDRQAAEEVRFEGAELRFAMEVPEPPMDVRCELRFDGAELTGTMVTPFGPVPLRGERAGAAPDGGGAQEPGEEETAEEEAGEAEPSGEEAGPATDDFGHRLDHPEWPVETDADRVPASEWARARGGAVLLRGGTLHPMTGADPAVGDLLIVDGLIEEVGGEIAAPAGVPVVDATSWHLMPGIIDAHSHLALDSINEGTMAITCECRIADMIHPESVGIFRAAAGGTAVVQSLHGSANPIGGQAAVWELDYLAPTIDELLYPGAKQGVKFALGENVKQSNWDRAAGQRFPNSRMGVEAVFRRAFDAALEYRERERLHEAGKLPRFREDVRLDALARILENDIHVQIHSYRADEILMFLEVCEDYGIERPTFQHVLEGYKVAPELAAAGAMASTFSDWWAYKFEVKDAIPWNVEIMHRAGVTVSINSDSDEMIRRLNTEAGKAIRYGGLDHDAAMATCTVNSARQLWLEDRLGSLEPGKDGTVSVFDAPPLSTYARPVMTIARGKVLFERGARVDERWQEYAGALRAYAAEIAAGDDAGGDAAEVDGAAPQDDGDASDWEPWTRHGRGLRYLIRNVTIHPVVDEPFVGSVSIEDGRIRDLRPGRSLRPGPQRPNTVTVDGEGKHLYPGFLNGGDVIGLWEIGAVRSSRDDRETGTDHPDLSAATAVHADSWHHAVTRMNGVAYVLVTPASGRIRGQAALVQMDGVTRDDHVVVPDLGLVVSFPRVRRYEQEDGPEQPDGVAELDRWFDDALAYAEQQQRFAEAGRAPLNRDQRLEALLPYARGEKPVLIEARDAERIMLARAWVRERGLDAIYTGADEAWKVAGYLGADGARLILGSVHSLPRSRHDPYDAPFRNPWMLAEAGCAVALQTDNPEVARNLPFQAATAAAWGLGRERALRAITLEAAEILGVDRYVGSIEEGKVATLILAADDPLDFPGRIEDMWIGGRRVELTSKQTELRQRYLRRLEEGR